MGSRAIHTLCDAIFLEANPPHFVIPTEVESRPERSRTGTCFSVHPNNDRKGRNPP